MAKQDYLFRYLAIINILRRNKEATFREISDYLMSETEMRDRPCTFSIRTFQRDCSEIRSILGIDIQYNFSTKVYYIREEQECDLNYRILEYMENITLLKKLKKVNGYIFFEKREALGTQYFHDLLHAIKKRIVLRLTHQKFGHDLPTHRLVEPYALKESNGRWYLFARDQDDRMLKAFGLDRILGFENTARRFDYPRDLDINAFFRHCFGVINPTENNPEKVVLSFNPSQGDYIKSYPLHESQKILKDSKTELRIELFLYVTHDFIMELLSHGDTLKVISPLHLGKKLSKIYYLAQMQYLRK